MSAAKRYEQVTHNRREIFFNNLVGGIGWALGATIGATLILAVLGIILKQINVVPFIGSFVSNIVTYVEKNGPSQPNKR